MVREDVKLGGILIIIGIILSGPPIVFLTEYFHPQPKWVDVDTFITNFHLLQTLPYWFGFILLIGNVLFIVSVSKLASIRDKIHSTLSIVCVGIYGSLVSINYAIQIAFVPVMVSDSNQILEIVSMVNPKSICWIIEMFAYAILGIAYWLVSIAFQGKGILSIIKYLMIFNGIASVLGVLIPIFDPSLLLESESIIGYVLWNVLIVLIMSLIIIAFRRKNIKLT